MNENSHALKCPRCGATVAADAPEGLCAACLMALSLATTTELAGPEVGPGGTKGPSRPPPTPPAPADIAQHFPQLEILEVLGCGGMGIVYKARQLKLDRLVALKVLAPEVGRLPSFAERFNREAKALARLNHPGIVMVYDFGQAGPYFYFVMEFVDGTNLRAMIKSKQLAPRQALQIVGSICDALQYAHDEGIVHRDIKPANILLDKKGRVKIADFGLAKLVGQKRADFTLTEPGKAVGTPRYMAPEQFDKPQEVDHRADIYSLGVVFYEMLTGEVPMGSFALPSQKVQVDVRLDEVVLRALAEEPDRRYQHASDIKTDVERVAQARLDRPLEAARPAQPSAEQPAQRAWSLRPLRDQFGAFTGLLAALRARARVVYIAAGLLLGLTVAWVIYAQSRAAKAVDLAAELELKWTKLKPRSAPVTNIRVRTREIERVVLPSLERLSTNRFLWSDVLNALSSCMITNIEVTELQGRHSYSNKSYSVDVLARAIPGPPRLTSVTETVTLTLTCRDYAPDAAANHITFMEFLVRDRFFLERLRKTRPYEPGPKNPGNPANPKENPGVFYFTCYFAPQTRTTCK